MKSKVNTFGPVENGRVPRYDEKDVMKKFTRHVEKCEDCISTLRSSSSRGLCTKGYGHVEDMGPYFFCSEGKPFSLVDRNKLHTRSRVLIPDEYAPVARLFELVQAGRDLSPRSKAIIHNSARHEPRYETVSPAVIKTPHNSEYRRRLELPRDRHYEPRRGNLYNTDRDRRRYMDDREQVIIIPGDKPRRTVYRI